MRISKLFQKALIVIIVLFAIVAAATALLSGWNLNRHLTEEYRSKGAAIAQSIADSSAEILLNRDASTVQAIVDQFAEITGVSYVLVADARQEIVSHTFVPAVPKEILQLLGSAGKPEPGRAKGVRIQNVGDFIHIAAPILAGAAGSVHVGMDRRLIRAKIQSAVLRQQGVMLVIFLASVFVAYVIVNRISQPLNVLADHAKRLAAEDFSTDAEPPAEIGSLSVDSKDEVGNLAASFMTMERALRKSVRDLRETTAAKERIESELKIAHDIQMSMVPKIFPPFPHRPEFDLFASIVPAREVGGDFYDFFFLDENRLCLAIGDVSGKGVPASLFMAVTRTLFRTIASKVSSPDGILSQLNQQMCRDNESCMFVTVFCCVLDIQTGRVEYSNGGHNLPYFLGSGGARPLENTGGMALGLMEEVSYRSEKIVLGLGEGLFLYTDGVTEAMDDGGNLFSDQRLEEFLHRSNGFSPTEIIRGAVGAVKGFSDGAPQSDDITMLSLRYLGTGAP